MPNYKFKKEKNYRTKGNLVSGVYTPRYGGQYSNVGEGINDIRSYINYDTPYNIKLKGNFGKHGNYIGADLDVYNLIDKLMKKKGK